MLIHRQVVPRVAKELLRSLRAGKAISVVPGSEDEAELAIAASLLDGLTVLEAPGEGRPSRQQLEWIGSELISTLMSADPIDEVFADDATLNRLISQALTRFSSVDDAFDRTIRAQLSGHTEGSPEWEAEYLRRVESVPAHRA